MFFDFVVVPDSANELVSHEPTQPEGNQQPYHPPEDNVHLAPPSICTEHLRLDKPRCEARAAAPARVRRGAGPPARQRPPAGAPSWGPPGRHKREGPAGPGIAA